MIEYDALLREMVVVDQSIAVAHPEPEGNMSPRTTAELVNKWNNGVEKAALLNLETARLAIDRVPTTSPIRRVRLLFVVEKKHLTALSDPGGT